MTRFGLSAWILLLSLCLPSIAQASTTTPLPNWVCAHPDAIFVDGYQAQPARLSLPSAGSGGSYPGQVTRTVSVSGMGVRSYYLFVPGSYSPDRPLPLVFALHGQAGSPTNAINAAKAVRLAWSSVAEQQQFIVVAPVASGASGGWTAPPGAPTDYDVMAAVLDDVQAAYNIDRSRRIGWGFSAGGHVMHDLVLNHYSADITIDTFAAYAVSAGALEAFACTNPTTCGNLVAAASRIIPLDIHVGTTDPLLPYATSDRNLFLGHGWSLGATLWFITFTGGHSYATPQLAEIWSNLCPFQLVP